MGPAHQLVQPQPRDEGLARVDNGYPHVVALREAVGGHHSGVSATDHYDFVVAHRLSSVW